MLILFIRTDKPEAEIGLYQDDQQLTYYTWQAHRQLAETIHTKLKETLDSQAKSLKDIKGLVVFKGPGSFTGLRIGLTVANTLAQTLELSIVATQGEAWIKEGIAALEQSKNDKLALPEYGAPVHITTQKK